MGPGGPHHRAASPRSRYPRGRSATRRPTPLNNGKAAWIPSGYRVRARREPRLPDLSLTPRHPTMFHAHAIFRLFSNPATHVRIFHPFSLFYHHHLGFFPRCRPPEWDSVRGLGFRPWQIWLHRRSVFRSCVWQGGRGPRGVRSYRNPGLSVWGGVWHSGALLASSSLVSGWRS